MGSLPSFTLVLWKSPNLSALFVGWADRGSSGLARTKQTAGHRPTFIPANGNSRIQQELEPTNAPP